MIFGNSKDLGYYTFENVFTFHDKVIYTLKEANMISQSGEEGEDLIAIHNVKKYFNGEILDINRAPIKQERPSKRM